MGVVVQMPARGRYFAHEAGRLAGVSGNTIGQWARRGYIRSSQSRVGVLPRVYSYQDVAEAIVVHDLIDHGVPHRDIRNTIAALRSDYGDWPLTAAKDNLALAPVGRRQGLPRAMLLLLADDDLFDISRDPSQHVLEVLALQRIASDLSRGGWAVRELPGLEAIEVNPDRIGGRPAIRGRRVPADLVAELAGTPAGRETLRVDYELTAAEVSDALRWWQAVSKYEQAA